MNQNVRQLNTIDVLSNVLIFLDISGIKHKAIEYYIITLMHYAHELNIVGLSFSLKKILFVFLICADSICLSYSVTLCLLAILPQNSCYL